MSRGTNTLGAAFLVFGLFIAGIASGIMLAAKTLPMAGAIVVAIGVCVAILGALFIEPDATKTALGSLSAQVGPYIPGGRRASDPPSRPPS